MDVSSSMKTSMALTASAMVMAIVVMAIVVLGQVPEVRVEGKTKEVVVIILFWSALILWAWDRSNREVIGNF